VFPVYRGHWDNVIGFLHAEDLLRRVRADGGRSAIQLSEILKPAHFVPPTKKVDEMLEYFQRFDTRAAVVIGEYGEVLGIVTIKDVLSFIFGEISGKMRGQEYFQEEDNDSFTVPGYMRLADLRTLTNFDIEDPLMNTIGGVTLVLFGRLAARRREGLLRRLRDHRQGSQRHAHYQGARLARRHTR
jgi:putative hemolysin